MVWRETGAVRNARPSRGQAATYPEEGVVEEDAQPPEVFPNRSTPKYEVSDARTGSEQHELARRFLGQTSGGERRLCSICRGQRVYCTGNFKLKSF